MKMNYLEKKVVFYWLLLRIIFFLIITIGYIVGIVYIPNHYKLFLIIPGGVLVTITMVYTFIFPFLEQNVYKYAFDEEKIIISHGIIFRSHIVIPIIQIQDISMMEGPIQLLFKIANISISTAGSNNSIISLNRVVAKDLVDEIQSRIHERMNKIIEGNINETL